MLLNQTLETIQKRVDLLQKAAVWPGSPRQRLTAVFEAEETFCRIYPQHDKILQAIQVSSQLGRPPSNRNDPIHQADTCVLGLVLGVIRDGVASGDLQLPQSLQPEALAFTIWALGFGARALTHTKAAMRQLNMTDGLAAVHEVLDRLMDLLQWQPLSSEWDYSTTRARVREVLFAGEQTWPETDSTTRPAWNRPDLGRKVEVR